MQQRNPNTAATPYVIAAAQSFDYRVSLFEEPEDYPVDVGYSWSGAHVETAAEQITAGTESDGFGFSLEEGDSTLVVTVDVDGYELEKTYYYRAVAPFDLLLDGFAQAQNDPGTPINLTQDQPFSLKVEFPSLLNYPAQVSYAWTGALAETAQETIESPGLESAGVDFTPAVLGPATLVVVAAGLTQVYYFQVNIGV